MTRAAIAGAVLVAALYLAARPLGPLPPLGPFLDPAHGVWTAAAHAAASRPGVVRGLRAPVGIVYDDRGVPHIFARSAADAYRALGYVVARDRLFQLELQTRATAGRLTELVGPAALEADREQRAYALAWAAERTVARAGARSRAVQAAEAYADGVNAWIATLRAAGLPLEYRLLDARPMRWEPVHTFYVLKRMGWTLARSDLELTRAAVARRLGPAAAERLFPVNSPIQEPIVPVEDDTTPDHQRARGGGRRRGAHPASLAAGWSGPMPPERIDPVELGSNNWAVAPERTARGHALLAGDPHLELTLPSVWYEVHLVVPGELDVYGATIPGLPGVVIGFNREVAWSFTNAETDALDYYVETVDDPERPGRYLLDGSWRPLRRRIEEYRGRRGELLATDTVYFTHRGPMRRHGSGWLSIRWTVLDSIPSEEALLEANRAGGVDEWLEATARLHAPAQNGLVADREGNIAIRSTGLVPIRPDSGPGLVVWDGSTGASDWIGYLPVERYPRSRNPAQGYLASANQQPVDPRVDATYLGADWPSPWRALRINALLRADSAVTVAAMRRYQTDPGSARADRFVPAFLAASTGEAARLLAQWDRRYTPADRRAILFELAMEELARRTWDELDLGGRGRAARLATPRDALLAALLDEPASEWWDVRATPSRRETRDDILRASLEAAYRTARARYGPPGSGRWAWGRIRTQRLTHLLRLPEFSIPSIPIPGGPGTLNPLVGAGGHGASWRMVVELGPEVRGWTIYPGGQSGNPASPRYADRVERWARGELEPALFPR
ncbi:MAG TPA: penicillin acylase family protein, partial [Gemmatimonadales bacterium]|nr:penicillin acylase family protein [Gemmatimonadales bacterium]